MEIKTPLSSEDAVLLAYQALTGEKAPGHMEICSTPQGQRFTATLLAVDAASRKQTQEPLLEALRGGHRKLATYQDVYKGDKELRRLLGEWEALIAAAESKA